MQYRQICEEIETTTLHKVMKKAEVMNVTPVACLGRSSVGRPLAGPTGDTASLDHNSEFLPVTTPNSSHNANILNNNVEINGAEIGLISNSNNSNISIERSAIGKKSTEVKVREQGSLGYVSERVRALSVSNRPKASSGQRFGAADFRASYNERLRSGPTSLQPITRGNGLRSGQEVGGGFVFMRGAAGLGGLYRSNSSLDLDHDGEEQPPSSPLRREYGSHGSINVASAPPETLYSILRTLKPTDPTKITSSSSDNVAGSTSGEVEATSPKARSKFQKLWDKDKPSIFKKLRSSKSTEGKAESKGDVNSDSSVPTITSKSSKSVEVNGDSDSRGEDIPAAIPTRRSAFAHYDCRSLAAQFNLAQMRLLLSERANTTTGASAAAMAGLGPGTGPGAQHHDSTEDLRPDEHDPGDGRSNHLINSCPFFRNELGGEGERVVSLSRDWGCGSRSSSCTSSPSTTLHRPVAAATVGLLEPPVGHSHWRMTLCPYVRSPLTVEAVDQDSTYYRNFFCGQEHQNWFGVDDTLGPVAVSVRREKVEEPLDSAHSLPTYLYRIIIRTSELFSCQGTVLEESLGRIGSEKGRGPGVREAIEYVCPQLSIGCLRLGQAGTHTEEALTRLDDLGVHSKFKVGVLYCRAGQTTEEEMYNNETAGPAFSEFLEMLGQRVRLKDFDKYRGGLDKKTDSTGLYSVYNQYRDVEVMFHVSTLLPFTPTNRKQLLRKRHIGNDIVTIIFQEPGAPPFSPRHIRSHFQHVFIVVQAINPCTEGTQYRVTVSRFRDVPLFGPMMPEGATFPKSKAFTDFLLAKAINGEIAALHSEKFAAMATRTRHEYLKDLALNHITSTTLDTNTKFSLMGFSRGGKKDKRGIKYIPDPLLRGALSWPLTLHDAALQQNVECVLGISVDTLVVVEEASAAVVFAAPCKSVIGWTLRPQLGMRIFYHQGECLLLHLRPGTPETDGDEALAEVVARLAAVTQGAHTQELVLRRNPAGLLGFNVQQDGVITEVEPYGLASQAGLRQGARLVEICTVTLATLSQEQMVDLLKTSMTVTVTVVPPHPDGAPRKGCNVPTCGFLLGGGEGDYENLTTPEQLSRKHRKPHHSQRYDRSLSPPRSSSSSGYGTGNSSRSFTADHHRHHDSPRTQSHDFTQDRHDYQNNNTTSSITTSTITPSAIEYEGGLEYERGGDYTGTLSSTSSGHSSDRWTEPLEEPAESPPPPLPARSALNTKRRGDLFQSSFHNRGGPANPQPPAQHPPYTHPSPTQSIQPPISITSSSPPPPFTHNTAYLLPSVGYTPPTPINTSSSSSPTSHPQGPGNHWHHHHYHPPHQHHLRLDPDSDNGNYAVPPSHPRPLHATPEDLTPHHTGLEDYDNAPMKGADELKLRQTVDHNPNLSPPALPISTTTTNNNNNNSNNNTNITPGQVSEYIAWRTERLNGNMRSSSLPGHLPRPHASSQEDPTSTSLERLHPTRSEDELSGSSGSPHTKRQLKGGNVTPSSTSSRNQSPRTVAAEARLRQAAGPRKVSQRNSANLGSSNLQEELFRLINPDYISDTESLASHENSERPRAYSVGVGPQTAGQSSRSNSSSLERAKTSAAVDRPTTSHPHSSNTAKPHPSQSQGPSPSLGYRSVPPGLQQQHLGIVSAGPHNQAVVSSTFQHSPDSSLSTPQTEVAEVVVLTARPATVISNSSTSSPAPASEYKAARGQTYPQDQSQRPSLQDSKWQESTVEEKPVSEKESGNREKIVSGGLDVDQEWTSLVNTATKAIQKSGAVHTSQPRPPSHPPQGTWPVHPPSCTRIGESGSTPVEPCSLHDRVAHLERCLAAEQQRSEQLEDEVTQLRSENKKLQEDSRAAAQQLHQFTEWFFNTIDKT